MINLILQVTKISSYTSYNIIVSLILNHLNFVIFIKSSFLKDLFSLMIIMKMCVKYVHSLSSSTSEKTMSVIERQAF